jgi:hypothetical protein
MTISTWAGTTCGQPSAVGPNARGSTLGDVACGVYRHCTPFAAELSFHAAVECLVPTVAAVAGSPPIIPSFDGAQDKPAARAYNYSYLWHWGS